MGNSKQDELDFGAEHYVQAIHCRIVRHFQDGGENAAFVAGIFGEWGCGKTRWLQRLQELFQQNSTGGDVTLPIFFNAWRYEKEPHLIVPMLKTAEQTLLKLPKREGIKDGQSEVAGIRRLMGSLKRVLGEGTKDESERWLADKVGRLKDSIVALACGLEGKLAVPGLTEVSFNFKDVIAQDRQNQERRREQQKTPADHFASIYYDLEQHLRTITGRAGTSKGPRLNFVFLIDDLDRCLPEKAVEVLEAIKLFLEVEGCAFVLGLDEEVISRGILHRYRDYHLRGGSPDKPEEKREVEHPITGHEYLEKIIHLPIRVPAVERRDAREFLLHNYPDLFMAVKVESLTEEENRLLRQPAPGTEATARPKLKQKLVVRETFLDLFLRCVPLVPRKMIRTAELFDLLWTIAERKGLEVIQRDILLRMVILQLFAPDLHRFGRQQPRFFAYLLRCRRDLGVDWRIDPRVEDYLESKTKENKHDYALVHIERPLWRLVFHCCQQRTRFDPRDLVLDTDEPDAFPTLLPYYTFIQSEGGLELQVKAGMTFKMTATLDTVPKPAGLEALPVGRPRDLTAFLTQLFSKDSLQWRNALEQSAEELRGKVFDEDTFSAIIGRIADDTEFVQLDWVELLNEYLTPDQLDQIFQRSPCLRRLSEENRRQNEQGSNRPPASA